MDFTSNTSPLIKFTSFLSKRAAPQWPANWADIVNDHQSTKGLVARVYVFSGKHLVRLTIPKRLTSLLLGRLISAYPCMCTLYLMGGIMYVEYSMCVHDDAYHRLGFNCECLFFANCEFFTTSQLIDSQE